MLDDTAKEKGYALMCVAEPLSDCRIKVIDEVSLLCTPGQRQQFTHLSPLNTAWLVSQLELRA